MIILKVSCGMGNQIRCVRYIISDADINMMIQKTSKVPLMMVHHIKNLVKISISIMFPLRPSVLEFENDIHSEPFIAVVKEINK
jgi:hypothetical protein